MLKKITQIIIVVACGCLLYMSGIRADQALGSQQVIQKMVTSVNEKDWPAFTETMTASERDFYKQYFADNSNTQGIKEVLSMSVCDMQKLDREAVEDELLAEEYPVLKKSHRIEGYLVTMDCKVTSDHHYFSDGINEFLIVLAEEDGEMRIVQFQSAGEELLEQ